MTIDDKQLYRICASCRKPTPEGKEFCQYCWSRHFLEKKVNAAEAQVFLGRAEKRSRFFTRRQWLIRIGVPVMLIAAFVFYTLAVHTDVFSKPVYLNSNPAEGQWNMYRHDMLHSGSTGNNAAQPQGKVAWTFTAGAGIQSSPAVVNGVVYFGSQDSKIYALDAVTGTKKWEFTTGSWVNASPVVVNGILYCGSNDGKMYALDANTGKEIWHYQTRYPITGAAAVAGGVVYFGGDDGVMYAVDAQNGAKHWTFATGGNIYGAPVVNNGVVYFGSSDGNFFALRAADGKFRLHFPTDAISSSPVVFGDNVYFTSDSGSLFGIYGLAHNWVLEDNIRPVWSRLSLAHLAFAPPQYSGLLLSAKLGKYSNSSPSIVGNSLFVGADNALIAYDIQNQRILWSHVTANRINSSPAVAGNVVYFGSDDKRIYAVNAADGSTIWQIATGDKVQSSPALANGMLYVGSLDGKLYAIK